MKMPGVSILLLFTVLIMSCSVDGPKLGKPAAGSEESLSDFPHWWSYYSQNIKFYKPFTAFDTDGTLIPRDSFMQKYSTGGFAVLKYINADTAIQYQLKSVGADVDEEIRNQLRASAYSDFKDFLKIGKPLKGFGFTSIDNRIFDAKTTKSKFVVMKFWFIGCLPCIAEMPELNAIVASNRKRDDVMFLSVAMDSANALKRFLKSKKFDYAIVAGKKSYLNDTLSLNGYPTHMLIDKHGNVAGICNNVDDLKEILRMYAISD